MNEIFENNLDTAQYQKHLAKAKVKQNEVKVRRPRGKLEPFGMTAEELAAIMNVGFEGDEE